MSNRLSWATRLERAEKRGKFTDFEKGRAADYLTCAIGERHNFPTGHEEEFMSTLTRQELDLGYEFYYAMSRNKISEAKEIYAQIQALP